MSTEMDEIFKTFFQICVTKFNMGEYQSTVDLINSLPWSYCIDQAITDQYVFMLIDLYINLEMWDSLVEHLVTWSGSWVACRDTLMLKIPSFMHVNILERVCRYYCMRHCYECQLLLAIAYENSGRWSDCYKQYRYIIDEVCNVPILHKLAIKSAIRSGRQCMAYYHHCIYQKNEAEYK
jgi:hypothetical protein